MTHLKNKRKRNKALVVVLFPVLALTFLVGWCMYWFGGNKRGHKNQTGQPKKDGVTFLPVIHEEYAEIFEE